MDGIGLGDFRCHEDAVHLEVGVFAGRRADAEGFICGLDVQAFPVGSRKNGYRADAHFPAGTYDAQSDFAAIGYEYFLEHGYASCHDVRGRIIFELNDILLCKIKN